MLPNLYPHPAEHYIQYWLSFQPAGYGAKDKSSYNIMSASPSTLLRIISNLTVLPIDRFPRQYASKYWTLAQPCHQYRSIGRGPWTGGHQYAGKSLRLWVTCFRNRDRPMHFEHHLYGFRGRRRLLFEVFHELRSRYVRPANVCRHYTADMLGSCPSP